MTQPHKLEAQSSSGLPLQKIIFIAILTFLFFGVAAWMVIPAPPSGFSWDDAWYLLMAEWFSPGSSHRVLAWTMLWITSYPPLFPLFITWSGADLANTQAAFIMNAFFLACGAGVAMVWFAREGFPVIAMTVAAILMVFNPVSLGYLPILFSEYLFIFLTTSSLAIACVAREWKWNSKWVIIGVIVALSVATRTAGWSLAAGFLVHLVFNRKLQPALVFAVSLGTSILIIPFLRVGLPPPSVNYMDMLIANMDNLGWEFFIQQVKGLVLGWSMLWGWGIGKWLAIAAVLPGFFVRLKANRADSWYVVMYLGMLLIWPWPGHMGRFLWPLLPCFLVAVHSSFGLLGTLKYRTVMASVYMGLILVFTIPDGIGRSLERLFDPPEGELFQYSRMHEWTRSSDREQGMIKLKERQQVINDLRRVGEIVGDQACIYSEMSPLVAIHSQRLSYPVLWNSLDQVGMKTIRCEFYYMLPQQLPGTGIDDVNRFSASHEELFRSVESHEPEGALPLSVFLRFKETHER